MFWDVDFSKINKITHTQFIIERILEYGDLKSVKWMNNNYDLDKIKEVTINSKNISKKVLIIGKLFLTLKGIKFYASRDCLKKNKR